MGILYDVLKGLPLNAVLREKINEIEAKYAALETENAILKDDMRKLREERVSNDRLRWDAPYYWLVNDDGTEDGPFCQACYDKGAALIRLQGNTPAYRRGYWRCAVCKTNFTDKNYNPADDAVLHSGSYSTRSW
jgi:hypothetical protein